MNSLWGVIIAVEMAMGVSEGNSFRLGVVVWRMASSWNSNWIRTIEAIVEHRWEVVVGSSRRRGSRKEGLKK